MNTRTINIDEGENRISIVMSFDENLKPSIDSYSVVDRSEYMRGLGDVIARATSAIGIKPCGGCKQRQETLNKLIPFNTNEQESTSDGTN